LDFGTYAFFSSALLCRRHNFSEFYPELKLAVPFDAMHLRKPMLDLSLQATENEVLTATKPFNRYEDNARKPDQQGTETEVAYTFRNRAMAFLHLAPPKFVYAGIEFKDGIVVKKSVNFYKEPRFV
jgi:hypothetical protein